MKAYNTWYETGFPSLKDFARPFDKGETVVFCRVTEIPSVENDLIYKTTDEGRPGQFFHIPSDFYKVGIWQNIAIASYTKPSDSDEGNHKTAAITSKKSKTEGIYPVKGWKEIDSNFSELSKYSEYPRYDGWSGREIAYGEQGFITTGTGDFEKYEVEFWSIGPLILDSRFGTHSHAFHLVTSDKAVDEDMNAGLHTLFDLKADDINNVSFAILQKGSKPQDSGWGFQFFQGDAGGQLYWSHVSSLGKHFIGAPSMNAGKHLAKAPQSQKPKGTGVLAYMSYLMGGHHHGGAIEDKHCLGTNIFGENINSDHLNYLSLVYANPDLDGPMHIELEKRGLPGDGGPFKKMCHMQYTDDLTYVWTTQRKSQTLKGKWFWWTYKDFSDPEIPKDKEIVIDPARKRPEKGDSWFPFDPVPSDIPTNKEQKRDWWTGEPYKKPCSDGYTTPKRKIQTAPAGPVPKIEDPEIYSYKLMRTDFVLGATGFSLLGTPYGVYDGQMGYSGELPDDFYECRLKHRPSIGSMDYIAKTTVTANDEYFFDYTLTTDEYSFEGGTADGMIYISPPEIRHWAESYTSVSNLSFGLYSTIPFGWLITPDINADFHDKDSVYFKPYIDSGKLELEVIHEDSGGIRCGTFKVCNLITAGTISGFWKRDAANTKLYPTTTGDDIWLPDNDKITFGNTTVAPDAYLAWNGTNFDINSAGSYVKINATRIELTGATGDDSNILIGQNAGGGTTGDNNTIVGYLAGSNTTTGYANTFIGSEAGKANLNGSSNTFIGNLAGWSNKGGMSNVALGQSTLRNNQYGHYNMAIGRQALFYTTGSSNVGIGLNSGLYLTTGSGNTAIGGDTRLTAGLEKVTVIGYYAGFATQSNYCIFIGAYAGRYETADYKLIIDSIDRGSEANQRAQAPIYGKIDATVANQELHFNANIYTPDDLFHYFGNDNDFGIYYDSTNNLGSFKGYTSGFKFDFYNDVQLEETLIFKEQSSTPSNAGADALKIWVSDGTATNEYDGDFYFNQKYNEIDRWGEINKLFIKHESIAASGNTSITLGTLAIGESADVEIQVIGRYQVADGYCNIYDLWAAARRGSSSEAIAGVTKHSLTVGGTTGDLTFSWAISNGVMTLTITNGNAERTIDVKVKWSVNRLVSQA